MESAPPAFTYLIREPFERGLKKLRQALANEELCVPVELDVAARIRRELGITLAPCRVLFVDCPVLLLEAATLDRAAVAFLPLHVAVAGLGQQNGIHLAGAPGGPAGKLHARVLRAVEKIATRQRPCVPVQ
jgi:uncharacterized protein (DUF302 family)